MSGTHCYGGLQNIWVPNYLHFWAAQSSLVELFKFREQVKFMLIIVEKVFL